MQLRTTSLPFPLFFLRIFTASFAKAVLQTLSMVGAVSPAAASSPVSP